MTKTVDTKPKTTKARAGKDLKHSILTPAKKPALQTKLSSFYEECSSGPENQSGKEPPSVVSTAVSHRFLKPTTMGDLGDKPKVIGSAQTQERSSENPTADGKQQNSTAYEDKQDEDRSDISSAASFYSISDQARELEQQDDLLVSVETNVTDEDADSILSTDPERVPRWTIWDIQKMAKRVLQTPAEDRNGNATYEYWKAQPDLQIVSCSNYRTPFPANQDRSWDQTATDLYLHLDEDLNRLCQFVKDILFDQTGEDTSPTATMVRNLVMGIMDDDPCNVFGFDELRAGKPTSFYWRRKEPGTPELRIRPLSIIWCASSRYLGLPWLSKNHYLLQEYIEWKNTQVPTLQSNESSKENGQVLTTKTVTPVSPKGVAFDTDQQRLTPANDMEVDEAEARIAPKKLTFNPYLEAVKKPTMMINQGTEELSDEDRTRALTQLNTDGMPFKYAWFYALSIAFDWAGPLESTPIQVKAHRVVVRALADLFETAPNIRLLPANDRDLHERSRWITKKEDLTEKIPSWSYMFTYFDRQYGNMDFLPGQYEKIGPKSVRSRVRLGFNEPVQTMQRTIHSSLRYSAPGKGTKCLRSPLQFGDLVRVGYLAYLPAEANRSYMERTMIKQLGFKHPLGMENTWIATTGLNWRRQTEADKTPAKIRGQKQWHIFSTHAHARELDSELSSWFNVRTPKCDFPYGCQVRWTPDSFACSEEGTLFRDLTPTLRNNLNGMRMKVANFVDETQALILDLQVHGMARPIETKRYGKITLMRFLYSILFTPDLAEVAAARARKIGTKATTDEWDSPDDEEDKDQAGPKVDDVFKEIKKKGRKKNTPRKKAPAKKGRNKPEKVEDGRPRPLFLSMFPIDQDNQFVFTVRNTENVLAGNVLRELPAFLMYYLVDESEDPVELLKHWIDRTAIRATLRRGLVWSPIHLSAEVPQSQESASEQEPESVPPRQRMAQDELGFVEDLGMEDPVDAWVGALTIDLEMSNVKHIDDGMTVTEYLEEAIRLKQTTDELRIAEVTITEQSQQLQAQQARLKQQEEELACLRGDGPTRLKQADSQDGDLAAEP